VKQGFGYAPEYDSDHLLGSQRLLQGTLGERAITS